MQLNRLLSPIKMSKYGNGVPVAKSAMKYLTTIQHRLISRELR